MNLDLYDDKANPRLQLRDNDWVVDRDVLDLECPPRKASLTVRTASLGAELSVSFQHADKDRIRKMATDIAREGEREMKMWLERMPEPMRGYGTHGPSPEERGREIAETLLEGIPRRVRLVRD